MLHGIWLKNFLLFFAFMLIEVSGAYVGICIGTEISNMPPESDIVSILQDQNIRHVRLYNADHKMVKALANTGIEVVVGVPNNKILKIGGSRAEAARWVKENIATFVPATNITHIAVGNEVLTAIPNAALVLVPAMKFIQSALVAADLNFQVKVSTTFSMEMIPRAFPPSTATFNSTWASIVSQLLRFLKETGSPLMMNIHPYTGYVQGNGIFPIEYALFQPLTPNKQIVDANTDLLYNNMFDAMVDAAYYSIQALNFSKIPVIVTETGWPWLGGSKETSASVDNALAYNSNLIQHVLNNSGTPSQPDADLSAYIFELFNEDKLLGPESARNWGIFLSNGTSTYSVRFSGKPDLSSNSSGMVGTFCVANSSAGSKELKAGLDWACGPGSADCSAIQPGQPCYDTDVAVVASYAYNDYYHRTQSSGGTCNFSNTAFVTTKNPNHGSCIFAGSSGLDINGSTPAAGGPVSPSSGDAAPNNPRFVVCIVVMLVVLF